jgi:Pyruvate/2-oxoacid:ferredoxin oxidoreductase delta subunit
VFLDAARQEAPEVPVAQRKGFEEVARGLTEPEARYEASRCLSCGNCFECDNCYAACPEQAIVKLGPGRFYRVDDDLCTGCAVCFEQCPCHAIEMIPESTVAAAPGLIGEPTMLSKFKVRA